jgi:hypothetical protein
MWDALDIESMPELETKTRHVADEPSSTFTEQTMAIPFPNMQRALANP